MSTATFVIPTIHPDQFDEFVVGSLKHIHNLRDKVSFALCCQAPWTDPMMDEAMKKVKDAGFDCRVTFAESIAPGKRAPGMTRLRHVAARLFPESDYYCFADDNVEFSEGTKQFPRSSGERYAEVMDYMDNIYACGVVCCVGALGGMPQQYKIKPTSIGLIATSRGLFIRNQKLAHGLFLDEVLGLVGGLEETAATYPIVDSGFFVAKQFFNPTKLKNTHKLGPDQPKDSIHNSDVIESNIQKWVRMKWNDHNWTHDGRKFPALLKMRFERSRRATMDEVVNNLIYTKDYK